MGREGGGCGGEGPLTAEAALAKEGVKLASGVPPAVAPYRLGSGDTSVTEKVHLTEQLAGILAAQKHVASQGDDARAQTNDV